MTGKIHINVSKGKDQSAHEGAKGNNPLRVSDDAGFPQMLWGHWIRQLGLEPGDSGYLTFVKDEEKPSASS